jgi:hypothetical protein
MYFTGLLIHFSFLAYLLWRSHRVQTRPFLRFVLGVACLSLLYEMYREGQRISGVCVPITDIRLIYYRMTYYLYGGIHATLAYFLYGDH